jgi:AraC-like DNA-binding protein
MKPPIRLRSDRPQIPGERPAGSPGADVAWRLAHLRPYVRQSGDEWRKPWFLKMRRLLDYLVVFIAEGTGRFTVGDSTFDVSRGDLIWIPPDTPHEMQGSAPVMHCLFAHFDLLYDPHRSHWDAYIPGGTMDLTAVRRLIHPPISDPAISQLCGKVPVRSRPAVQSLMERICLEHLRSPAGSAVTLSGMVLELVDMVVQGSRASAGSVDQKRGDVQAAAMVIQEKVAGNAGVSRLARVAGLSESHFRRVFRQTFGQSARSMHRQSRIRKACSMLVYQSMSVTEVAEALGFSTVHNFSRAFKQVTGMSPGEYRGSVAG